MINTDIRKSFHNKNLKDIGLVPIDPPIQYYWYQLNTVLNMFDVHSYNKIYYSIINLN